MNSDTSTWNLSRVLGALRRFWWIILGCAVVGGGVAFALAASTTPIFQSTSSLYFALSQGGNAVDLNQGSTYTQNQMLSFAQLATSSRVLQPVIDDLGLDTTPKLLARTLEVSIPQSTVVLEIQASSPDPEQAAIIADAVSSSLVTVVTDIAPTGVDSTPTVKAEIIDKAVVPTVQALPNKTLDAALGILLGLLIGLLIAFSVAVLDTRISTAEALGEATGKPVLGVVSRTRTRGGVRPLIVSDPTGQTAEDMRRVRSSLAYASLNDQVRTLLITSAVPGEGKSTVAVNLAFSFADPLTKVLLIDADLRKPRIAEYTGVEGSVGLTTVLLGTVDFATAKLPWGESHLDVLTSGALPPSPAEVITSPAMHRLIDGEDTAGYDLVVIDSPPVLSVADAALLGPAVDGVVVVVDAQHNRRGQILHAIRDLENAGARVIGLVFTKQPRVSKSRYYADAATIATSTPD